MPSTVHFDGSTARVMASSSSPSTISSTAARCDSRNASNATFSSMAPNCSAWRESEDRDQQQYHQDRHGDPDDRDAAGTTAVVAAHGGGAGAEQPVRHATAVASHPRHLES